jgi:hypothetical protein
MAFPITWAIGNIDFGRVLDSDTNNVVPKKLVSSLEKLRWLIICPDFQLNNRKATVSYKAKLKYQRANQPL